MRIEALRLESVCKYAHREPILDRLSFSLYQGETLAVYGADGRETQTLLHLLSGQSTPDEGTIFLREEAVVLHSPRLARTRGIHIISDRSSVFERLSLAENIFIGQETTFFERWRSLSRRARPYLDAVGLDGFSPRLTADRLTTPQRVLLAFAAALAHRARVLVYACTALPHDDVWLQRLAQVFQLLHEHGVSVLYLTPDAAHAMRLGDRTLLLRHGSGLGEFPAAQYAGKFSALLSLLVPQRHTAVSAGSTPLLVADALCGDALHGASFTACAGEISGICCADAAEKTELLQILGGMRQNGGRLLLHGMPLRARSPAEAIERGLVCVPSPLALHGVFDHMTFAENMTLPALRRLSTLRWVHRGLERYYAVALAETIGFSDTPLDTPADCLDDAARQKLLLARGVACNPQVLVLDEPFYGMDAAAREELLHILQGLAARGMAILLASLSAHTLEGVCRSIYAVPNAYEAQSEVYVHDPNHHRG